MTQQERPVQELQWITDGTGRLLEDLVALDDAALDGPSLLPGWSRRYLLSHLANNAGALRNLLHWARTGEERRMYASDEQRAADIAAGATAPAAELRSLVASSAAALWSDLSGMPAHAWSAQVITAQGLTRYAAEVPWMRVREVYVHAVDLAAGARFADLPPSFLTALLDDIAARRSAVGTSPALALTATGTAGAWQVKGNGDATDIEAPLATLAQWLSGRPVDGLTDVSGAPVPDLPAWL
ncbi:MAG TPA: maleylpyruvate isomerase family mycothiol-dependent enzyme [Trebonia sp.]|jgi:maleylpyruvate isomerase|nr:maleylpyruvate isomerase family mycothiol-dependent enzyme [Trebonia sp.]